MIQFLTIQSGVWLLTPIRVVLLFLFGIFGVVLLVCWLLKLMATVNAIRWIRKDGDAYRKAFAKDRPQKEEDYFALMEAYGGQFFPFGLKDFVLRRAVDSATGLRRWLLSPFQAWLFRYSRLSIVTSVYLCLCAVLVVKWPEMTGLKPSLSQLLLFLMSMIMLSANVLLAIESIYSYAILRNYAVLFHMLGLRADSQSHEFPVILIEFRVFVERFSAVVFSSATACSLSHWFYDTFKGELVCANQGGIWNWLLSYLQFVYFSATTIFTVGYGDISPKSGLGQFVAFLVMVQGFLLVVVVFASMMASSGSNSPSKPPA